MLIHGKPLGWGEGSGADCPAVHSLWGQEPWLLCCVLPTGSEAALAPLGFPSSWLTAMTYYQQGPGLGVSNHRKPRGLASMALYSCVCVCGVCVFLNSKVRDRERPFFLLVHTQMAAVVWG